MQTCVYQFLLRTALHVESSVNALVKPTKSPITRQLLPLEIVSLLCCDLEFNYSQFKPNLQNRKTKQELHQSNQTTLSNMSVQTTEFFATIVDDQAMEYDVTTSSSTEMADDIPSLDVAFLIVAILMATICVVGLLGNSAVLFIILRYKEMQNITNYFIANLAITDIAMLTICTLPTLLISHKIVELTSILCKTIQYMQFVAVQATCCTLTAMTIDRYYLIVHAVKSRQTRTTRKAIIINITIWIGSFVLHLPVFILSNITEGSMCDMTFAGASYYLLGLVLLMYVIPLAVISACYANILVIVWRKTSAGTESAQAHERSIRQKKKITRMVFFVILAFAVCWLPLHAYNLVQKFQPDRHSASFYIILVNAFALCLAYANSCINPFIYAFTTASFKKHFKKVFSLKFAESDTSAGAKDDSVTGYRKIADMSSMTCDTKV